MVGRQSSEASALLGWQHTCLTHLGSTEKVLAKPFSPNSLACCGPLVWNETKSTWPVIASEVPRAIGSIRTMSLKKKKVPWSFNKVLCLEKNITYTMLFFKQFMLIEKCPKEKLNSSGACYIFLNRHSPLIGILMKYIAIKMFSVPWPPRLKHAQWYSLAWNTQANSHWLMCRLRSAITWQDKANPNRLPATFLWHGAIEK
jgi:hypothetical protein